MAPSRKRKINNEEKDVEPQKKKGKLTLEERRAMVRARVEKWSKEQKTPNKKTNPTETKRMKTPPIKDATPPKPVQELQQQELPNKTPKWTKKEKLANARKLAAAWSQQQKEKKVEGVDPPTKKQSSSRTSKLPAVSTRKSTMAATATQYNGFPNNHNTQVTFHPTSQVASSILQQAASDTTAQNHFTTNPRTTTVSSPPYSNVQQNQPPLSLHPSSILSPTLNPTADPNSMLYSTPTQNVIIPESNPAFNQVDSKQHTVPKPVVTSVKEDDTPSLSGNFIKAFKQVWFILSCLITFVTYITLVFILLDLSLPLWTPNHHTNNTNLATDIAATENNAPEIVCFQNSIPDDAEKHSTNNCLPCPKFGLCEENKLISCELASSSIFVLNDDKSTCILSSECQQIWHNVKQQMEETTQQHYCSYHGQQQHSANTIIYRSIKDFVWSTNNNSQQEQDSTMECLDETVLPMYNMTMEKVPKEGWMIGLSMEYVQQELPITWSCYMYLLCVQLLIFLLWDIPLILLKKIISITFYYYPKQSICFVLGTTILSKIVRRIRERRARNQQIQDVCHKVRDILVENSTDGCAVLHVRDELGYHYYPHNKHNQRKYHFNQIIWPKVEDDINSDNRIAKSTKFVPNKGHMKWWTWIASTTNTPHRSSIKPKKE